jgi:hypothetical protein
LNQRVKKIPPISTVAPLLPKIDARHRRLTPNSADYEIPA